MTKPASFKDYFSVDAGAYQQYRPGYPQVLFSYLAKITPEKKCAWDCATGNGQSAISLSACFDQVIATDASAAQIARAVQTPGVRYRVASAEESLIESSSVDLVTVAQALHWFDLPAFTAEVQRVLKPGGVLAVWAYNLLQINAPIDAVVHYLYQDVLGAYWPPERQMVEQGYSNVAFPFTAVEAPSFSMSADWTLPQLIGYLQTWSALKQYQKSLLHNPLEEISDPLFKAWGDAANIQSVCWPLSLRVWRK